MVQQDGKKDEGKFSSFFTLKSFTVINRPCVLDILHYQNRSGVCTTVYRHLPLLHRSVQVHSRREGTLCAYIITKFPAWPTNV